jgi:hypothetical protein
MIFYLRSFNVQIRCSVFRLSIPFGHSAFGHSALGPYSALGPIQPFVFRPFVIRPFVFRPLVIRPFVIRPFVFRPYVGESSIIRNCHMTILWRRQFTFLLLTESQLPSSTMVWTSSLMLTWKIIFSCITCEGETVPPGQARHLLREGETGDASKPFSGYMGRLFKYFLIFSRGRVLLLTENIIPGGGREQRKSQPEGCVWRAEWALWEFTSLIWQPSRLLVTFPPISHGVQILINLALVFRSFNFPVITFSVP